MSYSTIKLQQCKTVTLNVHNCSVLILHFEESMGGMMRVHVVLLWDVTVVIVLSYHLYGTPFLIYSSHNLHVLLMGLFQY